MSLNFDLTAIPLETRTVVADRDGNPAAGESFKKGDRIMSGVTNALIWMCMGVGLNGITEDNLVEFAVRCRVLDGINGKPLSEHDEATSTYKPRSFTFEELQAHVGLRTNVSNEKRAVWLKRIVDSVERDIKYIQARRKDG